MCLHLFLVSVLLTGPSLVVVNSYRKFFTPSTITDTTKQSIHNRLGQLQTLLSACGNPDALHAVNTHTGCAINVLKAFNNQSQVRKLPAKKYYAPKGKVTVSPNYFILKQNEDETSHVRSNWNVY